MDKFDIENIPFVWVPRTLSGSQKESWQERFATNILFSIRELKNKKPEFSKTLDQSPEEYLKLHEEIK